MNNIVSIHGKPYMTVAGRVEEAHKQNKLTISTEIVSITPIVFRATVTTEKGTFVAHSAAYQNGMIEKQSPYEVAETSAVGRALGFAGFGIVDGIATADEVKKTQEAPQPMDDIDKALNQTYEDAPRAPEAATEKQLKMIVRLLSQKGMVEADFESAKGKKIAEFSKLEASRAIEGLIKLPNVS